MKRNGFSLIELLVVIAIIASVVAMAIPNLLGARQRAQDVKAKSEMSDLKNALRLYYNDFNSYPPSAAPGKLSGCGGGIDLCPCTTGGSDFATTGTTPCDMIYMKQMPTGLGSTILYSQMQSGNDFCLAVLLNNQSDPDIVISQNRCRSTCSTKYPIPNTKYWACAD